MDKLIVLFIFALSIFMETDSVIRKKKAVKSLDSAFVYLNVSTHLLDSANTVLDRAQTLRLQACSEYLVVQNWKVLESHVIKDTLPNLGSGAISTTYKVWNDKPRPADLGNNKGSKDGKR